MLERLEDRTVPSSNSGLSPAYGSDAGGGPIVVSGSGFSNASALTFGGVSASNYFVMSDTMIMATTPAHATGVVDVVVTAPAARRRSRRPTSTPTRPLARFPPRPP